MQAVIHSTVSPTVTRLPATWLGMSMQNLSSQDIMISTMSRLSAPRSAVNLAASVSRSSSHPKWNTRMSLISSARSLTTHSRTVPPQAQCGRIMAFKVAAGPVSKLRTRNCSGDFSVTPGPLGLCRGGRKLALHPQNPAPPRPYGSIPMLDTTIECSHFVLIGNRSRADSENRVITSSPAALGRCRRLTPTLRLHRRSGVMSVGLCAHDPSARYAGTSSSLCEGEEYEGERLPSGML